MTVRLVIDVSEPSMTDEQLIAELLHKPLAIVTRDGAQLAVEPIAMGRPHELDNSADVVRAAEQRLGLPAKTANDGSVS